MKRIVILGSGESGTGAAILAKRNGFDVFVSDKGKIADDYKAELTAYEIDFEEGEHTESKILNASEIIKSPGIPEKSPLIKQLRAAGIPVISEIEFAYRYKGDSKIVGITGSNGKSTTVSLLYHICQVAGIDSALVGNIGYSIARQVALDPKEYYITEISSFQLDDIYEFKADIAILLNITEDHLDRYDYKFENYIASKFKIVNKQKEDDYFIYNQDDPVIEKYMKQYLPQSTLLPFTMKNEVRQGAYIKDEKMLIKFKEEQWNMNVNDFTIIGKHNQSNSMAAGIAASVMNIRSDKTRDAVTTFSALEHRLQKVLTIKGVDYINDSKSTNVNSTWFALECIEKKVVLILGGVDKGNDYSILDELVEEKVKAIVCLGVDNSLIHDHFDGMIETIVDTSNMEDCIKACYSLAEQGDVVLLSPSCASFDLFKNFEDRGEQFAKAVKGL